MFLKTALTVLVVEPNKALSNPYNYLPKSFNITRYLTVKSSLINLNDINPEIVFLSSSFSASGSIKFLEALKNFSNPHLTPLFFVVDFSHRINFIPGISWGGKIAVIDSFISKIELYFTLDRILKLL